MNRRTVTLLLGLGLLCSVGSAWAVARVDGGPGEVLLFPLAVFDEDYSTGFSINNVSDQPMALQVVTREGVGGEAVSSQLVFLSPRDVWTFSLFFNGDQPFLVSGDSSCSHGLVSGETGFLEASLPGDTRQGWVEVFELGALTAEQAAAIINPGCNQPVGDFSLDVSPATGRLTGESFLINVPAGLSFSIAPTVLVDFFSGTRNLTEVSQNMATLADAEPTARLNGLDTQWATGVDAVSAVLALASAQSAFTIEDTIEARTDLAFTFPTRHFYADGQAPFVTNSHPDHDEAGQELTLVAHDRQGKESSVVFAAKCSPVPPQPTAFGPVVSQSQLGLFIAADSLLNLGDSEPATYRGDGGTCGPFVGPIADVMESGSVSVDFSEFSAESSEGAQVVGLPALTVSLTQMVNGTLVFDGQNVLVNFQLNNPVHVTREVVE